MTLDILRERAHHLDAGYRRTVIIRVDKIFAILLPLQWLFALGLALWYSPYAWAGVSKSVHPHVWFALFLGGLIVSLPTAMAIFRPGEISTRYSVCIAQMLIGSLLIHLTEGRIETHFHVFGSLAFLALYRDSRVLLVASLVVVIDHYLRGIYWPLSIFGVSTANQWRWLEHTGWVLFEDLVLVLGGFQANRIAWEVALSRAELEVTREQIEEKVDQKTAELRVANETLRREVGERSRAEAEALKAMETANAATRIKSEFLANMSHEIRTPMNGVVGMTELLLETELSNLQREYLELVRSSADDLMIVINDILDFSKIEAQKLHLDPVAFDVRSCLEETLHTLALRAHSKQLELVCRFGANVPRVLIGDPHRIRQIMVNLVGNAIKFTEHGEVLVSVDTKALEDGTVRLSVSVTDTGVGVPEEKRRQIFEPFEQADGSITRNYGGTGLGLAISSKLAHLMGGEILLESCVGKGSTFTLSVLLATSTDQNSEPRESYPEQLSGLSVLIVDDNATNRRILDETLSNWGAKPTSVESGEKALEVLLLAAKQGHPFEIALIDVMMPAMDGFTLIGRIRANANLQDLLILVLSSSDRSVDVTRSADLRISCFLAKPIRQSELMRCILDALPEAKVRKSLSVPATKTIIDSPRVKPNATRKLRVLLVEDHSVNQVMATRLLEGMGHEAVIAENGKKAIECFLAEPFDIILMDLNMPIMDGFEALEQIRSRVDAGGDTIPIIALTAHAMRGDQERCLAKGFDDYLAKPIRSAELFKILERHGSTIESNKPKILDDLAMNFPSKLGSLFCNRLLNICENDRSLAMEIIESFMETAPRSIQAMKKARLVHDTKGLLETTHGLKGISLTIGAEEFAESCRIFEDMARINDTGAQESALDALFIQWTYLEAALPVALRDLANAVRRCR